jgi:hypothetical protein
LAGPTDHLLHVQVLYSKANLNRVYPGHMKKYKRQFPRGRTRNKLGHSPGH